MVTLAEAVAACNGKIIGNLPNKVIGNTTIDSRECNNNSIFIAINDNTIDNICYTNLAEQCGATIICDNPNNLTKGIYVDDSFKAFNQIASLYRQKNAGRVLAITGSVGKTTVKELCVSIIRNSGKLKLNYTEGNKNNTIGLPLTLMKNGEFDITVLEAGISEPGEMTKLSQISRPDIAIITNIGKMHSEHLGTIQETAKEKLKITDFMSENGIILIPSEADLLIKSMPENIRFLTVGETENSDFFLKNIHPEKGGMLFSLKTKDGEFSDIFLPISGRHGAIDGAFAFAAGALLGLSEENIRNGLALYTPCGDRQKIIRSGNLTVISDCYNAGPESMQAAFEAFEQIYKETASQNTLKIFLLGDMLELGENAEYEHFAAGQSLSKSNPDIVLAYGELSKGYIDGAISSGASKSDYRFFMTSKENELFKLLDTIKNTSAVILIKGSRGMKLERFTSYLTN